MTWQDVMVGVQSGLLMFPINILIITIFRSIRPRIISKSKKDDPDEIFKPPAVSIPTVLNVSFVLFCQDQTKVSWVQIFNLFYCRKLRRLFLWWAWIQGTRCQRFSNWRPLMIWSQLWTDFMSLSSTCKVLFLLLFDINKIKNIAYVR